MVWTGWIATESYVCGDDHGLVLLPIRRRLCDNKDASDVGEVMGVSKFGANAHCSYVCFCMLDYHIQRWKSELTVFLSTDIPRGRPEYFRKTTTRLLCDVLLIDGETTSAATRAVGATT